MPKNVSESLREDYRRGRLDDSQISRLKAIGFRFPVSKKYPKHPVICFETGERFETVAAAAKKYGISKGCAQRRIQTHNAFTSEGIHLFYEEELPETLSEIETKGLREPSVFQPQTYICLETGQTYLGIRDIADELDLTYNSVACAIKRHGSPGNCGLHFYKVGENPSDISFVSSNRKHIRCIENEMEFDGAGDACRWLNVATIGSHAYDPIYKALRKGTVAYGYHWEYVDD